MNTLTEFQFYLSLEMCNEINKLRREIEKAQEKAIVPTTVRVVYHDFLPNEEMNESYFLEDWEKLAQ